jgi:hypothetical protein
MPTIAPAAVTLATPTVAHLTAIILTVLMTPVI